MGHGLTNTDHMAYVGQRPWHGFGTELPQIATAAEMIAAAKLGFLVGKAPMFIIDGYDEENRPRLKQVPGYVSNIREDTKEILGVVTEEYKILQNLETFQFLDALTSDPNGPKYETAGSLHGGRTVWALAKVPGFVEVGGIDPVTYYLFARTGHDGKCAFQVAWTPIRIVCQNTLSMAQARMKCEWRWHHVGNINDSLTEAKAALGFVQKKSEESLTLFNEFFKKQVTEKQAEKLLDTFLQVPPKGAEKLTDKQLTKAIDVRRDVIARFNGKGIGLDDPKLQGTGWTLLNAFDEWGDREPTVRRNGGISQEEARFRSTFMGRGQDLKSNFAAYLEKELEINVPLVWAR